MQRLDIGGEMIVGARELQEDCLAYSISDDGASSFVVLADGMGGHSCGEVASGIVVQTVTSVIEEQVFNRGLDALQIKEQFTSALQLANRRLARYQQIHPETRGMGTTLIVLLMQDERVYWLSVGDSLILLQDDKGLRRLNEDHSMAFILDNMVKAGKMTEAAAASDPRRSQLTSAVTGRPIPKIDINAYSLKNISPGALIVATDGLLTLKDGKIQQTVAEMLKGSGAEMASSLIKEVISCNDEEQDNTSIAAVRIS